MRSETESDLRDFFRRYFADDQDPKLDELAGLAGADLEHANTSLARYVWLPIKFDGDRPFIEWVDEWKVEDFD